MKARDNPFRTERVLRVRYRLRDETMNDLLGRLRAFEYRASIVGPKGTGKTTLLEDLGVALSAIGFEVRLLRLDDRMGSFSRGFLKQFFDQLTQRDLILFDGAERLNRFEWHRFKLRSKKAGGLIVTSHGKGLLPTLKECSTSPELLDGIIAELLNTESPAIRPSNVELYRRHKGNLREALREMYYLC